MISHATSEFWKCFYALPEVVQERARKAYELFEQNPHHPGLDFKRARGMRLPVYSARIDRNYRALGVLEGDRIAWFWIGPHAEYDRILERM